MIPGCPNGETHLTLSDCEKLDLRTATRRFDDPIWLLRIGV